MKTRQFLMMVKFNETWLTKKKKKKGKRGTSQDLIPEVYFFCSIVLYIVSCSIPYQLSNESPTTAFVGFLSTVVSTDTKKAFFKIIISIHHYGYRTYPFDMHKTSLPICK